MKIACDVDDVTVEFVPSLLDFYNSLYGRNLRVEDVTSFRLWKIGIGDTLEEAVRIIHDFFKSEFYERMVFVEGAREGILELINKNEVNFVSARYRAVRDRTTRFLTETFPGANVYYSRNYIEAGKTKAEICLELGVDFMIEDEYETALQCHCSGVPTLLLDKPWNRQDSNGLARVKNWQEVLERIKNKEEKK